MLTALSVVAGIWGISHAKAVQAINIATAVSAQKVNSNELPEAINMVEAHLARAMPYPELHANLIMNLAGAHLVSGNPDRALSMFAAVYNSKRCSQKGNPWYKLYPGLVSQIAFCFLLKGDLDGAEYWQSYAHELFKPIMLDAYIGARRGRMPAVIKDLREDWQRAESICSPTHMRALRILRAFALSHENNDGINDEEIKTLLAGARPCRVNQFNYCAVNWPEYEVFLQANGFSDTQSQRYA